MNRYLSSFGITASVYAVFIATLIYFMNTESCDASSEVVTAKVMKVSLLNLKEEIKPAKIEKKKEVVKKIESLKKPIVKNTTKIKTVPKITKTVPVKLAKEIPEVSPLNKEEKKLLNEIVEDIELAEKELVEDIETITTHTSTTNEKTLIAEQELQDKRNSFFLNLRELINKNKSYPNSARRRAIEGDVEVCFFVLENGNVKNITLISGKSIFKKSALEAIQKTFPINVDKTLFSFPKEFKITISYVLK